MNLVSNEPMVLIGPGSEWFWSMAQFVVVAVTLIGIYHQFRLQRAANAFEQLNRIQAEWGAEFFTRARLSAALALQAGEPPTGISVATIGTFWEGVASLVRRGHVDPRVVYESLGNSMRYWWVLLEDEIHRLRALESETSDLFVHFEWLAGVFAGFAQRDGTHGGFEKIMILAELDSDIARQQDRLHMLEASRAVVVAAQPRRSRSRTELDATDG